MTAINMTSTNSIFDAFPEDYRTELPTTARYLADAISKKDPLALITYLHSGNKRSRLAFKKITGAILPRSVSGTKKTIFSWTGWTEADAIAHQQKKDAAEKELHRERMIFEAESVLISDGTDGKTYIDGLISQGFNRFVRTGTKRSTKSHLANKSGRGYRIKGNLRGYAEIAAETIEDLTQETPPSPTEQLQSLRPFLRVGDDHGLSSRISFLETLFLNGLYESLIQDELFEEGNELDNRAFDDCLEQEDGGLVIYNIMMRAQKSKPLMAALKKQLNEENFKQWSLVHKIVVEKTSPQQTNLF